MKSEVLKQQNIFAAAFYHFTCFVSSLIMFFFLRIENIKGEINSDNA